MYTTAVGNSSGTGNSSAVDYVPLPLSLGEYEYTQTVNTVFFNVLDWSLVFAATPSFVQANSANTK